MRLHSLEITAFGPFADTVTVDFDALGADGLFLLHGQTGAGKTTVLDAVAFALYGTVPGARRDGKRLLSDHAVAGSTPKVVLDATLGGRRLRLERSPEFQRLKKRGVGVIKENAKANLTWLDGQGQNLTRLDEIGAVIGDLLGMSADQFFQVVLLPQGEFAKFLRADNEERGKLLERLFDTGRFGVAEKWLLERRSLASAALDKSKIAIGNLSGRIATAAGVDEQLDTDPFTWAQSLLEASRVARAASEQIMLTAKAHATLIGADLAKATATAQLQRRAISAREQMSTWTAGVEHRADLTTELQNARDAQRVAELAGQRDKAVTAAACAHEAMTAASGALAAVNGGAEVCAEMSWPPAEGDKATLEAHVHTWSSEVGRLTGFAAESAEGDRLQIGLDKDTSTLAALTRKVESLLVAKAALPDQLLAAESALGAALRAEAELPGLADAVHRAEDAHLAATELVAAESELIAAKALHVQRHSECNDAHEATLDLRERRLNGMAAELAGELEDGVPCTVCGSDVHPAPASAAKSGVSKADEDEARTREQSASRARDKASDTVVAVTRSVDALRQRSGGIDVEVAAVAATHAREQFRVATSAAAGVDSGRKSLTKLRAQNETATQSVVDAETSRGALVERLAHTTARISEIRARVTEAAGADETVDKRISRMRRLISAATRSSDERSECERASAREDETAEALTHAASDAGFESVDAALSAIREPRRVTQIEDELRAAHELKARAQSTLEEPDVVEAALLNPVDVRSVEAADADARARVESAIAEHTRDNHKYGQLEDLTSQLWSAIDVAAPKQAAYDELASLADVVSGKGQNSRKISLRSYVLAARLEEVAESASARLRRMSAGRYEFVHSDAAGSNGRRGGLGLDIRDEYTGVVRPAKTLSGGESFFASLALALGLADVVAAESGGVVLDTMFIDEGFGSLDSDTLESVMGVLDDLRAGGRVVGIVSHVDEMRQRIPNRLHVIRGSAGSSLEIFAAS